MATMQGSDRGCECRMGQRVHLVCACVGWFPSTALNPLQGEISYSFDLYLVSRIPFYPTLVDTNHRRKPHVAPNPSSWHRLPQPCPRPPSIMGRLHHRLRPAVHLACHPLSNAKRLRAPQQLRPKAKFGAHPRLRFLAPQQPRRHDRAQNRRHAGCPTSSLCVLVLPFFRRCRHNLP